jgi:hypothetical protein
MLVPLLTKDWQILRAILRGKKKMAKGNTLRLAPTRGTKDGSFLTELVDRELLEVMESDDNPFECVYGLTPAGLRAAEYGEYEFDIKLRKAIQPK